VIWLVIKSMDDTIAAFTRLEDADRYAEAITEDDVVEVRPVPLDDERTLDGESAARASGSAGFPSSGTDGPLETAEVDVESSRDYSLSPAVASAVSSGHTDKRGALPGPLDNVTPLFPMADNHAGRTVARDMFSVCWRHLQDTFKDGTA
jgi:hypothetical protein